ncbi:MAG TPA: transglycosylase SLT domain-containing protein [Rhodocyclaceae bacterium]|nr:transglycosylase SLT domain-containing protein [Rhodocyclaceae bacterium]
MKNATRIKTLAGSAGSFTVRLLHGGLVLTGLVTVAYFGAAFLQHESVSLADTGLPRAHAAALPQEGADSMQLALNATGKQGPTWDFGTIFQPAQPLPPAAERGEVALSAEMQRVRDWVARRYRVSSIALEPVLAEAENSAREAGLDPLLIVAMMAVESSFNPFAESDVGAQGLMQVIPRWHKDKIGEDAGDDALFDPLLNVQVGTQVLVEGLQRYGTLQAALQYYGGARNDPEARYSKKVLAMKQRIASAARANDDA